jgi:hypothetical protein
LAAPLLTEAEFIEQWKRHGSARKMADATGLAVRLIYDRRARLNKRGYDLKTTDPADGYETRVPDEAFTFARELHVGIDTGVVIVSSDHHYWPGRVSVAHKALLEVTKALKPRAKILNGDVFDGVSVCRHPPFGWSERPSVAEELEACQDRVGEIEALLPRGCRKLWNIGNHCLRFERALVSNNSEFAGVPGMRLNDHFPAWEMQWSVKLNPDARDPVMVKHRFAGGVHAAYNNTMKGGLSIVTGHTHILEVKPWCDYRGRRWGVQTGTVSDIDAPAFEYTENSPSPACSGFAVLTFKDGRLLPPELCEVIDGAAMFRGQVVA